MSKIPYLVTIGGGTGSYASLMGLKKHPLKLTAIVNMIDNGGSSGKLRDELGVLPPGDIRQCLVALSESSRLLRDLFNYRFEEGGLRGHSFGNIFLSTLEKQTGSMKKAIAEVGKILNIKGKVVPVTFTKSALCADLVDGTKIIGQHHVDVVEQKEKRALIKKVYLKPKAEINSDAVFAILEADYILLGPGDLYTSIIPNLLVNDVSHAIKKSKAKKIYVLNLMTKYGQTTNYKASDHVRILEEYLGKNILDFVLVNNTLPKKKVLSWYEEYEEKPVKDDLSDENKFKVVRKDLIKDVIINKNDSDELRRSIIRHDSDKLAQSIMELLS